jgi:DNA end-binding protein Ku
MPARSIWKGHLRLSLVTIPIRVYPATNSAATVSFHQLHRKCQTRIQYKKWCPHDDEEVPNTDIVKGYEFERGRYVVLEDKDIEKVRPESTRVVTLSQFADASAVDPILYDEPYYLAPDGKVAAESFAVLRDALAGKAAIGTVAMHGRERLVAIEPRESGMAMFTLRRANEIRSMDAITELENVPARTKPDEVALARKVMGGFERTLDLAEFKDSYEEALRAMIDKKVAGEDIVEPETPTAPPRVVNLMDALRKSLDQVSSGKKKTAKVSGAAAKKTATRGKVSKFPTKHRTRRTA